jgi:hypothetical protein
VLATDSDGHLCGSVYHSLGNSQGALTTSTFAEKKIQPSQQCGDTNTKFGSTYYAFVVLVSLPRLNNTNVVVGVIIDVMPPVTQG